jgi:TolB-like protein/DNA-binding winged helix-turn-helix (wHTH) protein/Tfp pilus assembly protein PilF
MAHAVPSFPVAYQFGVFQADLRARELRKHGIPLKLQDRPFQLLQILIQNHGQVVSREELRKTLWPDGTFVDFDHSISSAMNKLRTALNDSAANPRYIETVGRRGYRFIYPVTESYPLSPAPAPVAKEIGPPQRKHYAIAVVLVAVLISAALSVYSYRRTATRNAGAIRSIAVLPLRNLSNDPQQEYFSEGLTDELITRMALLRGLRVISRTSALQYKDSSKPLRQIARELNVDAVVEGSVLRAGERVRITAHLVAATEDREIWARSYERDQRDVLSLQDEVAHDIAENIRLSVESVGTKAMAASKQIDPQAHEDYLKARFYLAKRTEAGMRTAIEYFEQAIARDPQYALAYAGIADTYALLGGYSLMPQDEFISKARAAALRAVEIDPMLAEPHASLAVIAQNYDWDWATAEREYRRAIQLNPNYATAHHWYAEFLSFHGRFDEALAESARARQLDPLSLIIATDHAVILYFARQYDKSIEQFRWVLQRDANFPRAHMINFAYCELGRWSEAFADAQAWDAADRSRASAALLAYVYGRGGDRARAKAATMRVKALQSSKRTDVAPMLAVYLGAGDKESALKELQRGYEMRSTVVTNMKVNPSYDPLRSDPRFAELMRRVHLVR